MNGVEAMHNARNKVDEAIYYLLNRQAIAEEIGLTLNFDRELGCLEKAKIALEQGLKNENEHNAKVLSNTCAGIDWAGRMIKQLKEK